MRDSELCAQILGVQAPWRVSGVELAPQHELVTVPVEIEPGAQLVCPHCGKAVPDYDKRARQLRHLDTCQYQPILSAKGLWVNCPEYKIAQIKVPWAEPGSGFTALFEALVINRLKEAPIQAVSRQLGLSWNAIDRIMRRAVGRGLVPRDLPRSCRRIGVDEIAFWKRHDSVAVVTDPDQERGHVIHVAQDRTKQSPKCFYDSPSEA
jgi:transposase